MSLGSLADPGRAPGRLTIREFLDADRGALCEVYLVARQDPSVWEAPEANRHHDFDVSTAGEWIAVALWDSVPVGFASIWEPESFVHNLFVHPAFQGRGIGTALLGVCEAHHSSRATPKCLVANRAAQHFYLARAWRMLSEGVGPEGPYVRPHGDPVTPRAG